MKRRVRHKGRRSCYLPKCMREIRFDKIGFNILADTHNMRYAPSLKNWQLNTQKKRSNMSYDNLSE